MIETGIKLWEKLAEIEVEQAKEFAPKLSNLYLLWCIHNIRRIISEENPYIMPSSDMRYRAFVIKILTEHQKQELPDFDTFFSKLLIGKF